MRNVLTYNSNVEVRDKVSLFSLLFSPDEKRERYAERRYPPRYERERMLSALQASPLSTASKMREVNRW